MKNKLNNIFRINRPKKPISTSEYWDSRYREGGNSGFGSYDHLATFKAEVINQFVLEKDIFSVIEFGCGDGNQLSLANYSSYIGYDVSREVIHICRNRYIEDETKKFYLIEEYDGRKSELSLSLDVIFHLVFDKDYEEYMTNLFDSSIKYVIIYSSNINDNNPKLPAHVRHREFTTWVETNKKGWKMIRKIPNKYPYNGDHTQTSFCDFFIFEHYPNTRN